MLKKLCLAVSLMVIASQNIALAGTVSYDQVATSSDITVAKYNADLNTIYQDHNTNIQSSNILNDTVAEADMADDANPRLRDYELGGSGTECEMVYTGLLTTTTSSTLTGAVPSGTAYPRGYRVVKSSSTPKTFTASRWTFVDIDISGNFTYSEATIGGATPSVAPNSIRLSRVSTDGTQILAVQDLRKTSCTTGTFLATTSTATSGVSLDDILKNGQKTRRSTSAGRTPNGWVQGLFVSYDTATTFKVTSGSAYINGAYRFVSTDTTVTTGNDTPDMGVSGLDTGTVTGGPLTYYVYAVADQSSVATYSITYSLSGSAPSGVTNSRLIGSIKTDYTNLFTSRDAVTSHGISDREVIGAWITFNGKSGIVSYDSYNISGLADNGTGDYTVSWDDDFNNTTYFPFGMCSGTIDPTNASGTLSYYSTPATGSLRVTTWAGGSAIDPTFVSLGATGDKRK